MNEIKPAPIFALYVFRVSNSTPVSPMSAIGLALSARSIMLDSGTMCANSFLYPDGSAEYFAITESPPPAIFRTKPATEPTP